MPNRIDADHERFDKKIRKLKKDALKRYFHNDESGIVDSDGKVLKVPIRRLEIPRFCYGQNDTGGVSQGNGDIGSSIPTPDNQRNPSPQGDEEGDLLDEILDILEPRGRRARRMYDPVDHELVEVSRKEIAEGLEDYLKLPNLRETFGGEIAVSPNKKYKSIRTVGPRSLTDFRRTYKTALKRIISSGGYDEQKPVIIPINEDRRFRAPKISFDVMKAVIVFVLDCSGSMLNTLDFLQDTAWLADCWIEKSYPAVARRYVHYDHLARESTREEFYRISAGGENNMGIAYLRVYQILKEYPEDQYNRFVIHLTDGDTFGLQVYDEEIKRYQEVSENYPEYFPEMQMVNGNPLMNKILPNVNALFVCEAGAYYGGGNDYEVESGNYSELLARVVQEAPSLRNKIRCVSFDEERLSKERNECKMETIREWFSKKK